MISRHRLRVGVCARVFLAASLVACAGSDGVRVELQAHPPADRDPRLIEIRGQVAGSQAGLRYRWFSVAGECEPQVSDSPATAFRFAEGTTKDRVTVEVWRGSERVGQSALDVELDQRRVQLAAAAPPNVKIEITKLPPWEPDGGDATRADIAGTVSGDVDPSYKVVIYARADAWYIQPHSHTFHAIGPEKAWSTWTHTGSSYAALVVRPGFNALTRLDVLPQVGGYVLARTLVEGARR
jgi:hypothetical protein